MINKPTDNDFSGTGFMFSIDNLFVSDDAKLKMFNQESDNQQSLGDIDHWNDK